MSVLVCIATVLSSQVIFPAASLASMQISGPIQSLGSLLPNPTQTPGLVLSLENIWKQSTIKEINPEYSLEGLMLIWSSNILGHWSKGQTHWKRPWWWEKLRAGGEEGDRGWNGWMVSPTQWAWVWPNWEIAKDRKAWHTTVHGVAKCWTWLSDSVTATTSSKIWHKIYSLKLSWLRFC